MKKYNVKVNGVVYEVEIEESGCGAASAAAPAAPAVAPAPAAPAASAAPAAPAAPKAAGSVKIVAPMNGTVLAVKVNVGDSVKKGDAVVVLESMKMENDIPATADGVVASVDVKKGDTVEADTVLVTLG